jgi:hypothetical protein
MADIVLVPYCRVCGDIDEVICFPPANPAGAICPECCDKATHDDGETGHVWEYDRWERDHQCIHCGIMRRCTDYVEHDVD